MNVQIFGSVARGEDNPQSNIVFLVDLEEGLTLFDLGGAFIKLQDLMGRRVDIVYRSGLHWYLQESVAVVKEARSL